MVRSEARPRATRKSEQTRQRLLDAAARVLRDKGYAGARLSDIAERAGMHVPGVYYYFASKEDLVEEVLRAGVARACAFVEERVAAVPEGSPALDRLRAAIEGHVLVVLEIGDYTSANIRIFGQLPDDIRQRHLAQQRAYGDLWRSLLEEARAAGELRADVDLGVIRMLILGALNWTVEWYHPGGSSAPGGVAGHPYHPGGSSAPGGVAGHPHHRGSLTVAEVARNATTMICEGLGRSPVEAGDTG